MNSVPQHNDSDNQNQGEHIITNRIDDDIEISYVLGTRPKAMIDQQSQYIVKLNDQISGNISFKKDDVSH